MTATVAVLTPPGRGAIAVLHIGGPSAGQIVAACVRGSRAMESLPVGRIAVGRIGKPPGEEVVVARVAVDRWELCTHGGVAAVEAAVAAFEAQGARRAPWGEWVASQTDDALSAAAQIELARATTLRTAAILLDQQQGALRRKIGEIDEALEKGDPREAVQALRGLLRFERLSGRLTTPWRVAIVGRPNVGKSSLLNRLAGYERAIVFHEPGTTRDVVSLRTAIDGWPVELSDTAGQRTSDDELETAGAALALAAADDADLVLLVDDTSQPWAEAEAALAERYPSAVIVHNKVDLRAGPHGPHREVKIDDRPAGLAVSAATGAGIDALVARISAELVPDPPQPGEAVPFLAEQLVALRSALAAGESGDAGAARRALRTGFPRG